jgi:hypothetical protein
MDVANGAVNRGKEDATDKKDEIVRQLFGEVGDLIDGLFIFSKNFFNFNFCLDYSCAVESSSVLLHGRMYVTSRFLCFYSNLFGLEKKIRVPLQNIRDITKEKTGLISFN